MKIFLICLGAIFALFLLALLLRVGVRINYKKDDTLEVFARIGFLRFKVFPRPPKPEKKKKGKRKKREKQPEAQQEKPKKRFEIGGFRGLCELIAFAADALKRFARPLRVDELIFRVCIAGGDPAKDALAYGASAAVLNTLMPKVYQAFKVKKSDIFITVDFEGRPDLVFETEISGITIRILSATLIVFWKYMKIFRKRTKYE